MLRDRCSVWNVGVLWPNGRMDQDAKASAQATLCYMATQLPPRKGAEQPPLFGPCLLWTNSCPSQQLLSSCTTAHATVQAVIMV